MTNACPPIPSWPRSWPRSTIVAPDRTLHTESMMDIGGRVLELRHLGRGHTEGDVVVAVPDALILIAGDLVEQSGPPSFGDSYPVEWPQTLAELLHLTPPGTTVVPGHGTPVDLDFVRAQHDELTELSWLIRDGHADGAPADAVAAKAPYPCAGGADRRTAGLRRARRPPLTCKGTLLSPEAV